MNVITQFIVSHGYPILFGAVFARQIGLPVPAPGFLLAAGALAATGKLAILPALALAITACVLADWTWYEAGRTWGERLLHFIHHFAPDPEAADRRSRRLFARHGPQLLVLDKFVPGLDAVVPPLAGISGTSRLRFIVFETVGATLWSAAYGALGFVFSHDLDRAVRYAGRAGSMLTAALMIALVIYTTSKLARRLGSRCQFRALQPATVNPGAGPGRACSEILEGVHHHD